MSTHQHPMASRPTDRRHERDLHVLTSNLEDAHARAIRLLACDHIHIKALAASYARAYVHSEDNAASPLPDAKHIALFYERLMATVHAPSPLLSPPLSSFVDELTKHLTTTEQMCFYRALLTEVAPDPHAMAAQLLGADEPPAPTALGRIVYQHNIYTDEAFLHFSRMLPTAKACYADSFIGVCEEVAAGRCEYCILPLENTQDGKLVRFYGLIEKYELKIVLTCKVTTSDNRHSTVFGLCRRGFVWPLPLLSDRSACFELVFWPEPGHLSLSELLCAAECASLSLQRSDCLPRSDDEILMGAGHPFDLCFEISARPGTSDDAPGQSFLAFLLFLSIHAPTCLPLGIYQNI